MKNISKRVSASRSQRTVSTLLRQTFPFAIRPWPQGPNPDGFGEAYRLCRLAQ